jgi:hypothetical protein
MKSFLKTITLSLLSALAVSPIVLTEAASAQVSGMSGSYIGGGVSAGVTNEDNVFGGNVQGRFDLPTVPLSARGAWLFNGDGSALMPILSYDLPITPNANLYAGAGYSFVTGGESPLGDQDAVVLTTGVEAGIRRNVVVYGDVKLGLDAYEDSSDPAVSVQLGAAYRF